MVCHQGDPGSGVSHVLPPGSPRFKSAAKRKLTACVPVVLTQYRLHWEQKNGGLLPHCSSSGEVGINRYYIYVKNSEDPLLFNWRYPMNA